MKLQVGDRVLLHGPLVVDKPEVIEIKGDTAILSNNARVPVKLKVLETPNYTIEPWDEDKWNYYFALSIMDKNLATIAKGYKKLAQEEVISLNHKITKILDKFF